MQDFADVNHLGRIDKGTALINPERTLQPDKDDELILIGTYDEESTLFAEYPL